MTEFTCEPIIGHHVGAEIVKRENELDRQLDKVANDLDLERSERRRVEITIGDVDWNDSKRLSIDIETFAKMVDWFQEEVDNE